MIYFIKKVQNKDEFLSQWQLKFPNIVRTAIYYIKKVFKYVKEAEYNENKCLIFSNIKKIKKAIKRYNIKTVVLSKELEDNALLQNKLHEENIEILNGRFLFENMTLQVLEYISKVGKKDIGKMDVSILINEKTDNKIQNIISIAKVTKSLNIVTNNIEKFKMVEEYLYDKLGIMIRITNNTKKSLIKSDVIFNFDFSEELVNKYNLKRNGILINIKEKIRINSKKFNGINVCYYNTNLEELLEFKKEIQFECNIYTKKFEYINKLIIENKIEVTDLIGNNGKIQEKEFENSLNILDKNRIVG